MFLNKAITLFCFLFFTLLKTNISHQGHSCLKDEIKMLNVLETNISGGEKRIGSNNKRIYHQHIYFTRAFVDPKSSSAKPMRSSGSLTRVRGLRFDAHNT